MKNFNLQQMNSVIFQLKQIGDDKEEKTKPNNIETDERERATSKSWPKEIYMHSELNDLCFPRANNKTTYA